MYCTSCGTQRADSATVCAQCGQRIRRFPAPPAIPNYLVSSLFVTLCCCTPLGIVALVFSTQVNSKLIAGDIAGAQAASKNARTWMLIGVVLGILILGGYAARLFLS
ncbi:MAG TPA: CD225/dispanin family protein [Thermoanaerobaculia bacterium]